MTCALDPVELAQGHIVEHTMADGMAAFARVSGSVGDAAIITPREKALAPHVNLVARIRGERRPARAKQIPNGRMLGGNGNKVRVRPRLQRLDLGDEILCRADQPHLVCRVALQPSGLGHRLREHGAKPMA